MCGLIGTVLADYDAVFDPNDSNDRLVLGLKGTISEFELITMRNRLHRARLNKAKRGELFLSVPTGFVKLSASEAVMDPDEQVQSVIRMIFDKFDELGTGYRVFRYMVRHGILLGIRLAGGPSHGKLEWRPVCPTTLYTILTQRLATLLLGRFFLRCPIRFHAFGLMFPLSGGMFASTLFGGGVFQI